MRTGKNLLKIVPIFLLGTGSNLISEDKNEQKAKAEEILKELGIDAESRFLIRKKRN